MILNPNEIPLTGTKFCLVVSPKKYFFEPGLKKPSSY
jgi:hypothetical protein